MPRRAFLLALLFLAGSFTPLHAGAKRPNILFLVTDDQKADTISALGNPVIKTPNLDKLARRGFVFKNAYCMGSTMGAVCNPSRHMLLSGKSLYRYDPKQKEGTFGDVMRRLGYHTFHVSKRGNTALVYHTAFEISGYVADEKERKSGHHGRSEADRAIEFLQKTWRKGEPFFMYVGFAGPHDPRVAAKEWMDLYDRDKIPLPKNYLPHHPFNNGELLVRDEQLAPWPRTKDEVKKHLHDYYACISSIDHHIGRIVKTLEDLGELDNTIIVFTSDHGLAIGSHGLFGKQSLYQHSMNSPLIFAGPGIPKGQSDALAYLFDLFPTTVDLARTTPLAPLGEGVGTNAPLSRYSGRGVGGEGEPHAGTPFPATDRKRATATGQFPALTPGPSPGVPGEGGKADPLPPDLDGKSLAPLIRGKQAAVRDTIFLAYRAVQRAVRHGDWKLIRYPKVNVTQLFNMRDDPDEMNNLAANPAHAAKVRELMNRLAQQQKHFGDTAPLTVDNPQPAAVDEAFFREGVKQLKKKVKK
jgi:arylsulfatase A-like enzyme